MKVLQIIIHCLPREIDHLERVLNKLKESKNFIDNGKVVLDITLNLNDEFTDWDKSILDKKYFINKFKILENLSDWTYKNYFLIDENNTCLGINDKRRNSIRSLSSEITHCMYLDLDLFFSVFNLSYAFHALNNIQNDYHILSPQLTKLWDESWNPICNKNFTNKDNEFYKTLDPYSIEYLTYNQDSYNVLPINTIKFGGGWFNIFSANLLKFIDIPDSLGPYGLDDTFVMEASKLMLSKKYDIKQYIIEGMIVCENIKYTLYNNNPYSDYIHDKSFINNGRDIKQKYRKISESKFANEIEKFYKKLL